MQDGWQGVRDLLLQEGLPWHPPSPLHGKGLLPALLLYGVKQSDSTMSCSRTLSCYSLCFHFPACFGSESCFILTTVPQSHGQKKKIANSGAETPHLCSSFICLGSSLHGFNDAPFPLVVTLDSQSPLKLYFIFYFLQFVVVVILFWQHL